MRSLKFLLLCLAAVLLPQSHAQQGVMQLVLADMTCTWKLDGKPMGSLTGGTLESLFIPFGDHLIEASSPDGTALTHSKISVSRRQQTIEIHIKGQYEQQLKMKPETKPGQQEPPSPTWTDPATGLMWSGKDNGADLDWPSAVAFCSDLDFSGYKDWRLPTLAELEGIYDTTVSVRKHFDVGMDYLVHVKGNLSISGVSWASDPGNYQGRPAQGAPGYMLFGLLEPTGEPHVPRMNFQHFKFGYRALCVRAAGPKPLPKPAAQM